MAQAMKKDKQGFEPFWKGADLGKDILAGFIVALVSIPISLGYAQVAGLPAVYGLYGSLLPILVFGLLSGSRQFAVGVDAMPAAMVGSLLATLGIGAGSQEAMDLVPLISLLVAIWFLIFYFVKAGRVIKYISNPVMGGFISGVGCTIILMQIPKLLGGNAGTGELIQLLVNIVQQREAYNFLSASLGIGTVLIVLVWKKYYPKFPMSVVLMGAGALLAFYVPLEERGVKLLPQVEAGMPHLLFPKLSLLLNHTQDLLVESLLIALVVMAQTLLTTNKYAQKYQYKVDSQRELLSYAAMNFAGSFVGSCPINGSVSRTGIADQFGCKSHVMSITASVVMGLVLLFGTPLLQYLPVPVLTGIVVAALIGIIDFDQLRRLHKVNRKEAGIFLFAMVGVLLFGTIYGVAIGMALSFFAVIVRAVVPPKGFLGQIPGHDTDFYNLQRNRNAKPIAHTVIYRFNGNLFFANIGDFCEDIENAVHSDTKQVIVDARGIGNIDITAADRLLALHRNLAIRGIRFYLTEHVGTVNDQLRDYGAGSLIEAGAVRRTISLALRDAGIEKPYPLVSPGKVEEPKAETGYVEDGERLAEFEWAFGEDAEAEMELIAGQVAENMLKADETIFLQMAESAGRKLEERARVSENPLSEEEAISLQNQVADEMTERIELQTADFIEKAEEDTSFGRVGLFDEDELLDYLEIRIENMTHLSENQKHRLLHLIELRRAKVEEKVKKLNPTAHDMLREHRHKLAEHWKETYPEEYAKIMEWEKHGLRNRK